MSNYTKSISEQDIKDMSNETGLSETELEEFIELKKADELFHNKSITNNGIDENDKLDASNLLLLLRRILYMDAKQLDFATVTNIKTFNNKITIETKTNYPSIYPESYEDYPNPSEIKIRYNKKLNLPDYNEETNELMESFTFSIPEDKYKLSILLNIMNVSKPSKLVGKQIPVKPTHPYHYSKSLTPVAYNIHIPNKTIWSRIKYKMERISMKLKLKERNSGYNKNKKYGKYKLNKNIFLIFSFLTLPLILINSSLYLLFSISLGFYIGNSIANMLFILFELLTKEANNRNYIKQKLHK